MVNADGDNGDGGPGWNDRLADPGLRQIMGWLMLVAALVGVAAAVLGAVVGWRLLERVNSTTADTLAVTIDALDSIEDTIDVADGTVTATSQALSELQNTLSTLSTSLTTGADVVNDTGQLTETAAPALADATVTLRQMEAIGGQIDGFLASLANIPFTPDFDQSSGLGATFGRLADDIDPLDEELSATARSLETFEGSLGDLRTDVDSLVITIGDVNQELTAGEELLVQYRDNVAEARTLALQSQDELQQDQSTLRWLILIGAIAFAVSQLAPLWLGLNLILGGRRDQVGDQREP